VTSIPNNILHGFIRKHPDLNDIYPQVRVSNTVNVSHARQCEQFECLNEMSALIRTDTFDAQFKLCVLLTHSLDSAQALRCSSQRAQCDANHCWLYGL